MEAEGSSKGGRGKEDEDVDSLLRRLALHEDEGDDFVWEEEAGRREIQAKWLAIARVHTDKGFSPSALYADMRSAWNPAKDVRWRQLEDSLFTVQFACLADWNTAIVNGPWLFRNHALIIQEYDGFTNPRAITLDKISVWARVLKLPDNYLEVEVIKGMCRKMGRISEPMNGRLEVEAVVMEDEGLLEASVGAGVNLAVEVEEALNLTNEELGDVEWRFTGFYGDFNEILYASEQFGGLERQEWKMEGFREAIEECKLEDLGFLGLPYTWDNKQHGDRNIKVRLDRALGDDKFMECFDNTTVNNVQCCESDHSALVISVRRSDWIDEGMISKPFRFENAWTRHDRYTQIVEDAWQAGESSLQGVYDALSAVRQKLRVWSTTEFGSVKKHLKVLRERLEVLRSTSIYAGPSSEEKSLMAKISELLSREELLVKQRSRALWLSDGDRNTSFFHAKTKERSRKNKIKSLKRADGSVVSSLEDMEAESISFYQNLFTAQEDTNAALVTDWVDMKVDDSMNDHLCAAITDEEIERALFMMHPDRSPGPDGLTAGFYIRHWNVLKTSICAAVRNFLDGGDMPELVNSTVLVLIPKTTTEGANRLQEILEIYRIGSGQLVNKQKSAVFFSANADDNMKLAVHQGTAIPTEALVEKYLGLPTALGRSTDDQFEHIVATIKKLVSVRSAYKALLQSKDAILPVGSDGSEQSYWKKLWKMKVPPKVRNYWWRVIKGFIPCRSEIKEITNVKVPVLYPSSWAIDLIDSNKVKPRDAAIILCGAWAVWSERNARNHGERSRTVSESVKWTVDIAMDLSIIGMSNSKQTHKKRPKWKPPSEGVVKLNVDAGFSESSGEGMTGLVMRDHTGDLVRGQAVWYARAANALIMEAMAVRDGVRLACDLGISHVEVETDASDVVKLWKDRNQGRSEITSILQEIEE
ncbi:hypothetical protein QYE76_044987 [Lolium multiflorum]|uniref:RNase H type-1 domain-containing protein n=1 Tax=Lolium multiflorum TaxID=4521 RepID=A0AAD8WXL2_LOLMU|nr:hypothetical protein QYE76_044987 [Lolium multiflorum]